MSDQETRERRRRKMKQANKKHRRSAAAGKRPRWEDYELIGIDYAYDQFPDELRYDDEAVHNHEDQS